MMRVGVLIVMHCLLGLLWPPAMQAASFTGLNDLPGGVFDSEARATSADGSVIVGRGTSNRGDEAFRWTPSTGMVGLGAMTSGMSSGWPRVGP